MGWTVNRLKEEVGKLFQDVKTEKCQLLALLMISDCIDLEQDEDPADEMTTPSSSLLSSLLRPLSQTESRMVREALYGEGNSNDILARYETATVQRQSMHRLKPGKWLNDEIIGFFCTLLAHRYEKLTKKDTTRKRSHFFSTFFMHYLYNQSSKEKEKYNFNNVISPFSEKVPGGDIFKLHKLFIPINIPGVHWTLIVISFSEHSIQYYDSMGHGHGAFYLEQVFKYLKDESERIGRQDAFIEKEWKKITCTEDTPQQGNSHDCGVFVCLFSCFLIFDIPLQTLGDFFKWTKCNKEILSVDLRERIAVSILNKDVFFPLSITD
jgi:sentrin-specific protease 1